MRNLDSCRCWRCKLCPCKVRNKFLVNFWNSTIFCVYLYIGETCNWLLFIDKVVFGQSVYLILYLYVHLNTRGLPCLQIMNTRVIQYWNESKINICEVGDWIHMPSVDCFEYDNEQPDYEKKKKQGLSRQTSPVDVYRGGCFYKLRILF